MSESFELVRQKLDSMGRRITDNRQDRFMAQCPHHDDNNPSLEVIYKNEKVILACYAGCQVDEIVADLGLEMKDLFDGEPTRDRAIPVRSYVYEKTDGEPWVIVDRYYPKTFIQRLPGTQPGDRTGIKGRAPILYHAPRVWRALQSPEPPVIWLLEGEKDVERAERDGLVATTAPGGAGAKWDERYSQFLRRAKEVVIVVDQDTIKPDGSLGVGQQHGIAARMGLRAMNVPVRVVAPAAGKDYSDHRDAGYGTDDFVPEATAYTRPRGMTADSLAKAEFDPIKWAVAGILPAGAALLAAAPKAGKSWVALDLCLAVAAGGRALGGELPTGLGSALYLAREDNYRRLQSRMRLLMGGDPPPRKLEVIPSEQDWPGGEQGLANLTEWAEEVRDPRLVVIDTLVKIEPEMGVTNARSNAYSGNYAMLSAYKNWAEAHDCALLMVVHDNKPANGPQKWCHETGEDPFTRVSGTRAMTGAVDTLMFLETRRGAREGFLHVTGKDVAQQTLELHRSGPLWVCIDTPTEV